MSNEAAKTTSNNPFDIFIVGLKKGLNIGLYSLLPNVVMAFVLTYILQLWGVMDFLGRTCGGIMGIFDLPGQAITVLLATWMSCGAGVGVLYHGQDVLHRQHCGAIPGGKGAGKGLLGPHRRLRGNRCQGWLRRGDRLGGGRRLSRGGGGRRRVILGAGAETEDQQPGQQPGQYSLFHTKLLFMGRNGRPEHTRPVSPF